MGNLYNGIYSRVDRLWQWIAETLFVRFEFDFPLEELKEKVQSSRLIFAMVDGGLIDWFILSSWCRSQGLGAVSIVNRKRILLFSFPAALFQYLLGRVQYADLFTSTDKVPRLICLSGRERKKLSVPTPTEALLSDIYARAGAAGDLAGYSIVPVFILWKRHGRGGVRSPSEFLFGLGSRPNTLGKIWFLIRRRTDSKVSALGFLPLSAKEPLEKIEGYDENETMRAAKSTRRKILVRVQQEVRVLLGPRYHSPSLIKETVLRDPEIQELITKLSQELNIDRRKLMSRAYQDLTEIAADYRFRFIEVMYVFLTWLFSKVFDGINEKEKEWAGVREILKTKPVVFIPCHRSHLDYLVIPYLLFRHEMVTPHIAAGINLSFWPVGRFLRMGGAFFIRRTFRDDPLYQAVITKYVQTLLLHRYNVKFFIEGTRSRSGKMLAPAYGMLKMVMEAYPNHVCEDVALIPVSICYDEVPEQGSYSKELGGGQKVSESAIELIKSRKIVQKRFGKVYVRLARPIFVRDLYQPPETDDRRRLQKTAFQVCKSICDVTPITPKSLVSTVLLCHRNPLLSVEEILRCGRLLADYTRHAGMELSVAGDDGVRRGIEQTLRRLKKSGVLLEIENVPRRYVCDSRKRTVLNFYKNNASHCLVLPGILLLAYYRALSKHTGGETNLIESIKTQALLLRDILKFEFFFNPRAEFLAELEHCAGFFLGDFDAAVSDANSLANNLAKSFPALSDLSVFSRVTGELIESYWGFGDFVRQSPEGTWEKKVLLTKVFRSVELRQQQGDVFFPESLSHVNYSNALLYFENRGILTVDKSTDKTLVHRTESAADLDLLLRELSDFRELMQEQQK